MDTVVAHELEVIGSHGMQAYLYEAMFGMIAAKKLNPQALIGKIISLGEAPNALSEMDKYSQPGVTVISFDESEK
jgi:alcohol dehydrogenase